MRASSEPTRPLAARSWRIRGQTLSLDRRTLVMGIVNVTPDSFSDGGRYLRADEAVAHARRLVAEGAHLVDVGGESTRPGSDTVPVDEEIRRVVPVVDALRDCGVPVSIDTRKALVARAALDAGAAIVNDVSALADPAMAPLVAQSGAGLVLMHMRGEPKTMQTDIHYDDVVAEVHAFLRERASRAERAGVPHDSIVIDPGLGFGKRSGKGIEDNALLLRATRRFAADYPVLVGASRKSFIGNVLKLPMADRLEGSVAAAVIAAWEGASIVRVHDVQATRRAIDLVDAVRNA